MSEKPNWIPKPTEDGLWWFVGEDAEGDISIFPMLLSVHGDHAEIASYIGGSLDKWYGLWLKVETPEPPPTEDIINQLNW